MASRNVPRLFIALFVGLLSSVTWLGHVSAKNTAGAPAGALRLQTLSVHDKAAAGGIEAFRMLIPVGWQTSGGVEWRHNQSNLATVVMRIWNPKGSEALELFPIVPFTWTQGGIVFFPPGSNYMGNVVMPVVAEPGVFVQKVVLPRHRQKAAGLRLVERTPLPDVAKAVAGGIQEQGVSKQVKAEKVRIEYQEGGKAMQEDIYCVMAYSTSAILPGTTFWGPERLYSFRAEKGKLDETAKLLHTMVASMKINLAWFNQYLQVVQLWQQGQRQSIQSAGELSRYIAKTNDEISAMIRQSYETRQASQDRISANFSRSIRGVESYHNPFEGRPVELPSDYRDVWVSSKGEYLFSNDAGVNPNVGDTQTWKLMKPEH
jgi:hypothetical protein